MKKRWTRGRAMTSGPMGQKSWANRWVNGRPMTAEPTSTSDTTTVVARGWAKYKKALPGDERHHRAHGEQDGPEGEEHRDPLPPPEPSDEGQIRPDEGGDQGSPEAGGDQHHVEEGEGDDDALEHHRAGVAERGDRRRQVEAPALGAVLGGQRERRQPPDDCGHRGARRAKKWAVHARYRWDHGRRVNTRAGNGSSQIDRMLLACRPLGPCSVS